MLFCQSEIWISVTGDTDIAVALRPVPRLMNLFLCPSVRDEWRWNLSLINVLFEGFFKSERIPTVIASEWMLSAAHILKHVVERVGPEQVHHELAQNDKMLAAVQKWTHALKDRVQFYYGIDLASQPDNVTDICLHP